MKVSSLSDLARLQKEDKGRPKPEVNQKRSGSLRSLLRNDPAKYRSNSVKKLTTLFDPAHKKPASLGDLRDQYDKATQPSVTANATFSTQLIDQETPKAELSRGLAILQKRLSDYCEKLRSQEARHIEERLSWQAQTIELDRLRKERDFLIQEKSERERYGHELQQKQQAVSAEKEIKILKEMNKAKTQQIRCLRAQLEEKIEELDRETELNTESILDLQANQRKLEDQNSQKDLQIEHLEEQLKFHTSQSLQVDMSVDQEGNHDSIENLLASLPVDLHSSSAGPPLLAELSSHSSGDSKKTEQIEELQTKLADSQSKLEYEAAKNADMTQQLDNIENKWKEEVQSAKEQNKQDLDKMREKLLGKLSLIHKERKQLQRMKKQILQESMRVVSGTSGLQEMIENLQAQVTKLEADNLTLREAAAVDGKKKRGKSRSKSAEKIRKSRSKSREKKKRDGEAEKSLRKKIHSRKVEDLKEDKRRRSLTRLDPPVRQPSLDCGHLSQEISCPGTEAVLTAVAVAVDM